VDHPETQFVWNGASALAYQVLGQGTPNLLFLAGPSEVLVSQTVRDLVAGSGLTFVERGERELKGIPGTWRLFAVAT
jgi:hypothetical protein